MSTASNNNGNQVVMQEEQSFVDNEDQVIGGGFNSMEDILDARPKFIKEEFIKDIEGRPMTHPDYDPTTLYIPEADKKSFTPAMYQYWEIKQYNYDKILFFKLGKFYEIFYNDAIIC